MTQTLFDWQEPIYDELESVLGARDSCLLVAPPGAGKTYLSAQWAANRLPKRLLVFCPKSAIPTWERVLNSFGVAIGKYSTVMNYEQLTSNSKLAKSGDLGKWRRKVFEWALPDDVSIIFDEAHRMGGIGGKTKICGMLI